MGFEIPASCTLPTAAHPVRQGEFEALFATALTAEPIAELHRRFSFAGGAALAATVRDLAARESACCSFFDFVVSTDPAAGRVVLDVRVPAAQASVLDGLTRLVGARNQ